MPYDDHMETGSPLAEEIVELIPALAINLRLSTLFERPETAGLTPSQLLCALLVDQSEEQRLTVGQIARQLSVSAPAATALVDRLVSAELLARSRGKDRRVVWISLTELGTGVINELRRGLAAKISSVLDAMERTGQDALLDALRKVAIFAEELGGRGSGASTP